MRLGDGRVCDSLFQMCEARRASLRMAVARRGIWESGVRKMQVGPALRAHKLHRDDGFGSFGAKRASHPGQFHQVIGDQSKKSSVVRVPLSKCIRFVLEFGLEEKYGIDLRSHEQRAGCGKPEVESHCPR